MRSFLINELEPIAYLVYFMVLLLHYFHSKQFRHQVLAVYYFFSSLLLYAGLIITSINNNWSYNLVFFLNIGIFSWYFYHLLSAGWQKTFIIICLAINTVFFIYTNTGADKFISGFNSNVYGVAFLSILLYTFFYLYQSLAEVKEDNLLLHLDFWLICGFLLYFLGSFVIVILYAGATPHERGNMWRIHNVILFLCAFFTLLAHLKISHQQKNTAWTE